ncbi:hypothetical protein BAE44_0020599 [Dichanthelium oligosanthes]|uniref:Uncharacterized protein n=1 Tax=Dichanthelium oligosanthes TaxID=888268 RepID=A0A1E5UZP5_9POAL|nr:hypothetical protein BAE44_0020599 [Dichanthelium oligosanthes]
MACRCPITCRCPMMRYLNMSHRFSAIVDSFLRQKASTLETCTIFKPSLVALMIIA